MSLHEPVDLTDLLPLPPFAGEEAHDELAALDLLGHLRELLGESVDLGRQAWPDRRPGTTEQREDHQVHDHDRERSAIDQPSLREPDEAVLTRMSAQMTPRGPDSHGWWAEPEAGLGFGHRRLAIVDPSSEGHQPMHSASGQSNSSGAKMPLRRRMRMSVST